MRHQDFEERKRIFLEKNNTDNSDEAKLASANKDLSESPFLQVTENEFFSSVGNLYQLIVIVYMCSRLLQCEKI